MEKGGEQRGEHAEDVQGRLDKEGPLWGDLGQGGSSEPGEEYVA